MRRPTRRSTASARPRAKQPHPRTKPKGSAQRAATAQRAPAGPSAQASRALPAVLAGTDAVRPVTVEQQQALFLKHYAAIGVVTAAAKITGIDRQRHYEWLEDVRFPDYPERFARATHEAAEVMEAAMVSRGVQGWDEPVYQGGELVGHKRVYSDRLLEIGLRARLPEKYSERQRLEHTGAGGGPIETRTLATSTMTDEQLAERLELVKRSLTGAIKQLAEVAVTEKAVDVLCDLESAYEKRLAERKNNGSNGNGSSS